MTRELLSLLRRVEAAGGPVEMDGSGEVAFIQLGPRLEVVFDLEAPSDQHPRYDALLIHALRHDAIQRHVFVHQVIDFTPIGSGFSVLLEPHTEGAHGNHENEACAWLLAWLDAFEDTE